LRVLVIGEPCIDVIHKADGKVFNEPGGISYSVAGGAIFHDGIEVVPVIGLHLEDELYFRELFDHFESVNMDGLYSTPIRTRRVDLFYEDDNNRWECSTKPTEATTFDKIQPFLPAEGIHVNLISGCDIELETLRLVRNASASSHIHLDLHNIVMEHLPDGKRIRVPRPDYLEWCRFADTVQLNEDEARAIDPSMPEREVLAEKILATGVKAVVITLAEKGLVLFTRDSGRTMKRMFDPHVIEIVDSTGCGDVFGATFLHGILLGKSFVEAVEGGIKSATKKLSSTGPCGLLDRISSHV
jgi:sugar/nucleoside kinase (ribokinase family)